MTIRIILVTVLLALSGCATVEGFGRDVSAGARKVNDMM